MIVHVIELAFLGWALYCAWRAVRSPDPKICVATQSTAHVPIEFAFQTYLKIREYYLELSPAHRKYEAPESVDQDVIHVWEKAGFQMVKHQYRIAEVEQSRRMALVSERSEVTILGLIKSYSRSETTFSFASMSTTATQLDIQLHIVFPSTLRHFLSLLVLTDRIWQAHAVEEMQALARLLERRFATQDEPRLVAA